MKQYTMCVLGNNYNVVTVSLQHNKVILVQSGVNYMLLLKTCWWTFVS